MARVIWQVRILRRRLVASIRERGFLVSCRLALKELLSLVWLDRTVLKFHVVMENAYRRELPVPDVEIREATPEDYPELLECSEHFDRNEMLRRLALGHRCVIARTAERIVFYGWIGRNEVSIPLLGRRMSLDPDTAYLCNAYTVEEYRGHRILPAGIAHARRVCRELGLQFAFALADLRIGVPVRAYAKLVGANRVSVIRYRRRFGRKTYSEREVSFEEAARVAKAHSQKGSRGAAPGDTGAGLLG